MKKNNPTQPRSSEGDQPGRADDFIDSIGQYLTFPNWFEMSAPPSSADVVAQMGAGAPVREERKIPIAFQSAFCARTWR
jgi:hypothetical protein